MLGIDEGFLLGSLEGTKEGLLLGIVLGFDDAVSLGSGEGSFEGMILGGSVVGAFDGCDDSDGCADTESDCVGSSDALEAVVGAQVVLADLVDFVDFEDDPFPFEDDPFPFEEDPFPFPFDEDVDGNDDEEGAYVGVSRAP